VLDDQLGGASAVRGDHGCGNGGVFIVTGVHSGRANPEHLRDHALHLLPQLAESRSTSGLGVTGQYRQHPP
jgi:hypothetical protein